MELTLIRAGYTRQDIQGMSPDEVEDAYAFVQASQEHYHQQANESAWMNRAMGG